MLKFRIPGKSVVERHGHFVTNEGDRNGFVLVDYYGKRKFVFQDVENGNTSFHFNPHKINVISYDDYIIKGEKLVKTLSSLGIQKTVFSRIKSVPFDHSKTEKLFEMLVSTYPNAFVYCLSDEKIGTWMGATPETLLRQHGNHGFTVSLAGTKKTVENRPWTKKEELEQAFVSSFISESLHKLDIQQVEMNGPYSYQAGPVQHLRTDFEFPLSANLLPQLIEQLHPTPAVCGLPRDFSRTLIEQIEPHDRLFYTGYLGWKEPNNTQLFVNLRCCQITKGYLHLYLGGGYTKDSDPESEWFETENKARTFLDILEQIG